MIPEEAVEAAKEAMREVTPPPGVSKAEWLAEHGDFALIAGAIAAAAPYMAAESAVSAVLALHRELPCLDEDGDPIGGSYCEECKDLDEHSGERVHEVFPCLTVREITAALAGKETFTAMRDRIEAGK